jgi:hypothetical protein
MMDYPAVTFDPAPFRAAATEANRDMIKRDEANDPFDLDTTKNIAASAGKCWAIGRLNAQKRLKTTCKTVSDSNQSVVDCSQSSSQYKTERGCLRTRTSHVQTM